MSFEDQEAHEKAVLADSLSDLEVSSDYLNSNYFQRSVDLVKINELVDLKKRQPPERSLKKGIFIYPYGMNDRKVNKEIKIVIIGHIQYPGIYYLPKGTDIKELVYLCRPLQGASTSRVTVRRENGEDEEILKIYLNDENQDTMLKHGDVIKISYLPYIKN